MITEKFADGEALEHAVLSCIENRASIRKFKDLPIEKAKIDLLLNAGLCAPTARNRRPFHFLLTCDKQKMLRIAEDNPNVRMLETAAAAILVCGDTVAEDTPQRLIEDCAAATQNILLAIHALGLGGVWCGVRPDTNLFRVTASEFNLPESVRPVSLIAFGVPDEEKKQCNRYDMDKIHVETW